MFDEFKGRRVLLLQGPIGPFFQTLARGLDSAGAYALKVNLNAADAWYSRACRAVSYRGTFEDWGDYLRQRIADERIDAIIMFGDSRPYHRVAHSVAGELGVQTFYFEEGYLRPDYVTFESGGTNFLSGIPKDKEFYLSQELPPAPSPRKVGNTFFAAAWYAIVYAIILAYFSGSYPGYRHHRRWEPWHQAGAWWLNFGRKWYYTATERGTIRRLNESPSGFFLVPLQVYDDYQVQNSRFECVEDFMLEVATSFADTAPADCLLVFKHHPRDRGHRSYASYLAALETRLGLQGRVLYVHDVHLPSLLKAARGTVVINSTVGISSLYHGTPVKCLDESVYSVCASPQTLDEFFRSPTPVDRALVGRYIRWLKHNVQLNGSFYCMDFWTPAAQRLLRDGPTQDNELHSSGWNIERQGEG